ncbi:type IV pili methyl-accepting chemotaxis transducer N-terminal domain-containing protein [Pseudomonas sp. AA-38]|uniref:type IV pili methyl-accepting chemotaxis transducer N-terminal domain-containing protein n=1 Tax=Pseudomonas sp. AA-38 TaxID=3028807 RepID=UPI0023F9ACFC|nr:type IV pili methyl-accepting chemotaxis transducer N-terminal domain-containing protein [Pseudomonas sp. AA-38]
MLKKYLILLALGLTALVSAPLWAAVPTDSEAMNMAGLQRSLGQRMAKDYLMIGADVRVDAAQRQLQETIERFEASQKALGEYAPNPEIKAALAKVDATWATYRQQLEAKPEQAKAAALLATSETLLQQTQAVTDAMAKHLGEMGATVNRSGWARVQTQRIAMLYMAKSWRVQVPDLDAKLDKSVKDFETILGELEARGTPNEEIAAAQRRARAHWGFTLKGIDLHAEQDFVPTVITVSTDSLFRQLNELTRLYAGLKASET